MEEYADIMECQQVHVLLFESCAADSARRCGQLASFGWRVTEAGNPHEALRVADAADIELVLLHMTPKQAADSALPAHLRACRSPDFMPIVVLSEDAGDEIDRCRCLDGGVDDILPAGIGSLELKARLSALLRMKSLHDALEDSRRALQDALRREHDLLEKLQADNDMLHKQVVTDPLTRLYNVRYFEKFIRDELHIARRYGHHLGLLMLDLDHFKMVNDRHGHPMGDFVLKEFSVLLKNTVRDADVVARTGGEEFSIILPRADRVQADKFARRILAAVRGHTFENGATRLNLTCSIGAACFGSDPDVEHTGQLIYFADQALLLAKQSGRDRVVHWSDMDKSVRARLKSEIQTVEVDGRAPRAEDMADLPVGR